jgi:hypothetical protein
VACVGTAFSGRSASSGQPPRVERRLSGLAHSPERRVGKAAGSDELVAEGRFPVGRDFHRIDPWWLARRGESCHPARPGAYGRRLKVGRDGSRGRALRTVWLPGLVVADSGETDRRTSLGSSVLGRCDLGSWRSSPATSTPTMIGFRLIGPSEHPTGGTSGHW